MINCNFGQSIQISGKIASNISTTNGTNRFSMQEIAINERKIDQNIKVYIIIPQTATRYILGDHVILFGELSDGFGEYFASMYYADVIKIQHARPPNYFLKIRQKLSQRIKKLFSDESTSGMLLAYLFGDMNNLSDEFIAKIRGVGIAHLVVVSGMHLSIFAVVIRRILCKKSRIAVVPFQITFAMLFYFIIGVGASILRAVIALIISQFIWYFGRKIHPMRMIIYIAAIMLFLNPLYILNIGWQLSFLSYIGILILQPILQRFLYGSKTPSYLAQSLIVSFAAQLFCLPASIYYFGGFSIAGFLVCLLIAPTLSYVIYGTVAALFFHMAPFVFVSSIFVFLITKIINFHILLIN